MHWRRKLARGIIEAETYAKIIALGFTKNKARKMLGSFLERWLLFFQKDIWKNRCTKVAEWERSLGIDNKKKKIKTNKKKKGKMRQEK